MQLRVDVISPDIVDNTQHYQRARRNTKVIARDHFYRGCAHAHTSTCYAQVTPFQLTAVTSRKLDLQPLICETEPSEI